MVRYYDEVDTQHEAWRRPHPIDRLYGITTSGWVPGYVIDGGSRIPNVTAYAGSQPSIERHALGLVDGAEDATFVDLGCGKGRALAVASEFPFKAIVGVELSPELARIARANAAIIRRTFPERPAIAIVTGDAVEFRLPDGPLVLFLYHPFGESVMRRLIERLERRLATKPQPLTVVYYNPVYGALFDESAAFARANACSLTVDETERGFGPDESDTVVLWRDRAHAAAETPAEARRAIVAIDPGWRAGLAER